MIKSSGWPHQNVPIYFKIGSIGDDGAKMAARALNQSEIDHVWPDHVKYSDYKITRR